MRRKEIAQGAQKGGIQGISTASAARAETLSNALGTRLTIFKRLLEFGIKIVDQSKSRNHLTELPRVVGWSLSSFFVTSKNAFREEIWEAV